MIMVGTLIASSSVSPNQEEAGARGAIASTRGSGGTGTKSSGSSEATSSGRVGPEARRHGKAREPAKRVAAHADPLPIDALVEEIARIFVLLQHAGDQERDVQGPGHHHLREGSEGAAEFVEERVPHVTGRRDDEPVAGQDLGQEEGLVAKAPGSVGKDDEGKIPGLRDQRFLQGEFGRGGKDERNDPYLGKIHIWTVTW